MKTVAYNDLLETGHGFIVFNPNNYVEEEEGGNHREDSIDFVYNGKNRNATALRYIQYQYLITGATAREMLKHMEHDQQFWDAVDLWVEAEIYYSEYPSFS